MEGQRGPLRAGLRTQRERQGKAERKRGDCEKQNPEVGAPRRGGGCFKDTEVGPDHGCRPRRG